MGEENQQLTNLPPEIEKQAIDAASRCYGSKISSSIGALLNGELPSQGARDYADAQCATSSVAQVVSAADLGKLTPNETAAVISEAYSKAQR